METRADQTSLPERTSIFLELEGDVVWIIFEQGKLFIGSAANVERQRLIVLPETRVRLMDHYSGCVLPAL